MPPLPNSSRISYPGSTGLTGAEPARGAGGAVTPSAATYGPVRAGGTAGDSASLAGDAEGAELQGGSVRASGGEERGGVIGELLNVHAHLPAALGGSGAATGSSSAAS